MRPSARKTLLSGMAGCYLHKSHFHLFHLFVCNVEHAGFLQHYSIKMKKAVQDKFISDVWAKISKETCRCDIPDLPVSVLTHWTHFSFACTVFIFSEVLLASFHFQFDFQKYDLDILNLPLAWAQTLFSDNMSAELMMNKMASSGNRSVCCWAEN